MLQYRRLPATGLVLPIVCALSLAGCAGPAFSLLSFAGGQVAKGALVDIFARDDEAGRSENVDVLAMADKLRAAGDAQNAALLYSRAHAIEPKNATPLVGLGESLATIGADAEAVVAFTRALALDPQNERALRGIGKAHLMLRQPDLAATYYRTLLAGNPHDAQAINGLGIAQDMAGEHKAAQDTYRSGLSIDPANRELRNNLGLSLALSGAVDEAIEVLQTVNKSPVATALNRQNLALVYGLAGRADDAALMARTDLSEEDVQHNMRIYAAGHAAGAALMVNAGTERRYQAAAPAAEPVNGTTATEQVPQAAPAIPVTVSELPPLEEDTASDPMPVQQSARAAAPSPTPAIERDQSYTAPTIAADESATPTAQTVAETETAAGPATAQSWLYRIQLASYRSTDRAMEGWKKLERAVTKAIGAWQPQVQAADLGPQKGVFYRLRAGEYATRAEARASCERLRAAALDCLVIKTPAAATVLGDRAPPALPAVRQVASRT